MTPGSAFPASGKPEGCERCSMCGQVIEGVSADEVMDGEYTCDTCIEEWFEEFWSTNGQALQVLWQQRTGLK